MAYTTTQLNALEAALARGEQSVSYEGRTVVYRSVTELQNAILEVRRALANAATTPPARQVRVTTSKGF